MLWHDLGVLSRLLNPDNTAEAGIGLTYAAGTSRNAKKTVTPELLHWADMIFVMEQKHKNRLVAEYQRILQYKPLHVLDIPDDYQYMAPELITLLEQSAEPFLTPFILK